MSADRQAPDAATARSQAPAAAQAACPPFAIERIDHVVFRVTDLARSVTFYEQVLGCEVVRRRTHLGLVHLRAGVSMIDLISVDGTLGARGGRAAGHEGRNVDHLCLRIEPFDEAHVIEHLHRHGLAPLAPADINFGAEGEGPSLYFADPDGHAIELKGPAQTPILQDTAASPA